MHNDSEFYNSVNTALKATLNHPVREILEKESRYLMSILEKQVGANNWNIDSKHGKMGEHVVLNSILKKPETHIIEAFHAGPDYDHKYDYKNKIFTTEVKTDLRTQETGNIAFELRCNGNLSGIYRTLSNFYHYVLPGMKNEILVFDRIKLYNFIKDVENSGIYELKYNCGQIGQKTDCLLIKYQEIKEEWKLGDILLKKDRA